MPRMGVYLCLVLSLALTGCIRTGYETLRQIGYQECLGNSPRPAEDCQSSPDYDQYRQQRKDRYPE